MGRTLTLELSDEVYTAAQRDADLAGASLPHWVAAQIEQQYRCLTDWNRIRAHRTEEEKREARTRFERHFGEIDLGIATGADNEQIDADLAREYTDTHKDS